MKFGNVSHTIIQLPQFFNSEIRKLDTFKVPRRHQYFRYCDLEKSEKDLNYNNNFRKILSWSKKDRIHYNKPEITMKSTLTTTHSQRKSVQTQIRNSNESNAIRLSKVNFTNSLRKTVDVILQRIRLSKETKEFVKSRTQNQECFKDQVLFQTYDREEMFQKTLKDKVLSMSMISNKTKEQFNRRHLASQTKKCFDRDYNPTPNFKMTIKNSNSMHNMMDRSGILIMNSSTRSKLKNTFKSVNQSM